MLHTRSILLVTDVSHLITVQHPLSRVNDPGLTATCWLLYCALTTLT